MLDRMLKTITSRMDTYTAAAREQRATIERERAGDEARQHAGREFENAEGFTTPLPKAAQRAQNAYARARRDFERNGGASALTLAITMMIARERRDEAAAALKAHLEAEAHRRATGVHKDIAAFFDLMFSHGVEPRHLAEVRPETLAIICDLVRWDGHDPQVEDADSPMPQVFGLYASRLILEPGQFGDRSRSVPGVIVAPARYTDQRHYRFDLLGPSLDAPVMIEDVNRGSAVNAVPEPLSQARAQAIAEVIVDRHPFRLPHYWPEDVEVGDFEPSRLIPALQRWVDSGDAWMGAQYFLAAAERGEAADFIADRRLNAVNRVMQGLLDGDERALADAREVGLEVQRA